MRKDTVTYKDFDNIERTKELYFNISKTEIADNLDLEDQLRDVLEMFKAAAEASNNDPNLKLTRDQVQQYLNVVKRVMRLAYGVREGEHFRKSDELWESFKDTAVYDEFLFSLFVNPEKANDFLIGVLPQDLREQAAEEVANRKPDVPDPGSDRTPEDEALLQMDPRQMSQAQLQRVMALRFGA